MKTHPGLSILCLTLVAACSSPRIDTSSDEAMKGSVARVRESLPQNQRARFDSAVQIIVFKDVSLASLFSEARAPGVSGIEAGFKEFLNGKTGAEVIAAADSISRARAKEEIRNLEERQATAERARAELAKFVVLKSRFHVQKTGFMDFPIIDVTVRNGTTHPVSRAYFVGTLATPGRSVPWVKDDDLSYHIRGGIEPGEQASWSIHVSSLSGWGSDKIPNNVVLTLEVVGLDGANDSTLASTTNFTSKDKAKLDSLRARFPAR
jgi:hypothetical protein